MRNELDFASGEQHDLQPALLILMEFRTCELHLVIAGCSVLHFEGTAAAKLNPVMEIGSAADNIGSETGAGIVDFEKLSRRAGAIFHGDRDVIGMTA